MFGIVVLGMPQCKEVIHKKMCLKKKLEAYISIFGH